MPESPRTEPGTRYAFFEHGFVQAVSWDPVSRQAAFSVTVPASIVQTVTPPLLGAGKLDQYVLHNPVAAWIPVIGSGRLHPAAANPDMADRINRKVREKVQEILDLFLDVSRILVDPSDLIPALPLGTYVNFRFRCRVDGMIKVLSELDRTRVAGVPEFRYALSSALAEVLKEFGSVIEAVPDDGR